MTLGSVGCGALGLVLLVACGSASTVQDGHGPAALRLCESPHSYLRATNHHLLREMCAGATLGPTVNLHGDLHLEQYVVTHDGSGIVDFDDTALGPVELDLAHLAVSIRLTAQARGWDGGAAWRAFLSGYGEGLSHPDGHSDAVEFDRRVRAGFSGGRLELLRYSMTVLRPLPTQEAERFSEAFRAAVDATGFARDFAGQGDPLQVVAVGRHGVGIGSSHAEKILLRVRGATDAPEDDRIFELKEILPPSAPCISADSSHGDRVRRGEHRIGEGFLASIALAELDERLFWVFEWSPFFRSLETLDERLTETELREVLVAMGEQLGKGHPRGLNVPTLVAELDAYVTAHGDRIWAESEGRSVEIQRAWRAHRASSCGPAQEGD